MSESNFQGEKISFYTFSRAAVLELKCPLPSRVAVRALCNDLLFQLTTTHNWQEEPSTYQFAAYQNLRLHLLSPKEFSS